MATIINDPQQLKSPVKEACLELLKLHPEIRTTETLRTAERQAELYAQGRTKPGKIVTWVKHSNHQDGVAFDICFKGATPYPSNPALWQKVAATASTLGLDWGYALWKEDKPHFQGKPNLTPKPDKVLVNEIMSENSENWEKLFKFQGTEKARDGLHICNEELKKFL